MLQNAVNIVVNGGYQIWGIYFHRVLLVNSHDGVVVRLLVHKADVVILKPVAFQKLLERYNNCIAARGDYFKGD